MNEYLTKSPSRAMTRCTLPMIIGLIVCTSVAAQITPATDAPKPKSPEESRRTIRVPADLRIDLVAAEPLVADPTAVAFDERGRLFVCEIHGYNLDGYLDIVELNKTGQLDRAVRRVRNATDVARAAALKETYGTVKLLSDTDGDGRMDKVDVWADRLPPSYGLVAARGGVIVVGAPDVLFLADRDGDGRAEVRETLFTGFQRELIERGISNPRWGPDNWIYVAAGGGGGTITGPKLVGDESSTAGPPRVQIGHTDFRFKPDGSAIEPVTGTETMFGLTMTDYGERFHTTTRYVVPLPYNYLARNPFVPSPGGDVVASGSGYTEVYPISQPDPWRLARGRDPEWVKFYGESETRPNGRFTSPCGQMIYRADALPQHYHGNYFVCDPANNLVHRCLLEREGAGFKVRRAPGEEHSEFLAASDQWFRPINLSIGPDGAVYLVDMYREIIEDFSAIPRFLQQQYVASLIAGDKRGRIWRISANTQARNANERPEANHQAAGSRDAAKPPVWPASLSPAEIVPLLAHPNPWWRETAQRLLLERGERSVAEPVRRLLREGAAPQARLHALYTLDGLAALTPQDVQHALADSHYGVRLHALRLADRWLDSHRPVLEKMLAMTADEDELVRLHVAMSLGESRDPAALDALARLAAEHGADRWMDAAILSSVRDTSDVLCGKLLATMAPSMGTAALLGPLAESTGARRDLHALAQLLRQIADVDPAREDAIALEQTLLDGLSRGLEHGVRSQPGKARVEAQQSTESAMVASAVEQLLARASPEIQQRALRVAGLLKLGDSPTMQAAWDKARRTALDVERPLPARLAAISILSAAEWSRQEFLKELLDARQPPGLQLGVIAALARSDNAGVAPALLANWTGLAPNVQEAIVDALFARQDRLPALLDAHESGVVPTSGLSALRREQLFEHADDAIRRRARALLAVHPSDDRAAVLKRFEAALSLPRDANRGAALFEKHCSKCHKLDGEGFEVGPDLGAVRTRPDATLVVDVLDPSSTLTHGYTVYSIATHDGRVLTGLLAEESATSVVLRREKGETDTILRKDIDQLRASSKSLMPEGFEKEISTQELADLIGYLRQSLGPVLPPGIVLFDEEREFVAALTDGSGGATLITGDKQSGSASLKMTPPQRSSARMPGWNFQIVEHPQPAARSEPPPGGESQVGSANGNAGTFRYLRFAWKSAGARGIVLELAASGRWPPADKPLRRYSAGKNTSGWQAVQVSPEPPGDWAVVTVDLWKDFGEFTLTGIGPAAFGGPALFDRIELLRTLDNPK